MWLKHLLFPLLMFPQLSAAWIQENEPNDLFSQANPAQCGDTVYCGFLSSVSDADNFRFLGVSGDSVILLTFSCDGSETNTLLVLYDEQNSVLAVNDNGGPQEFSQIRFAFNHTADYVARVVRAGPSPDSTYNLWISCPHPPPEDYDLCETARVIPSLPYYNEGSTQGQTSQAGTPSPDVFYTFFNSVVGDYSFVVCADLFDARVQIYGGCIHDAWDDANQGCNLGAELTSYSLAPGPYWIMVEGTAANELGNFSLEVFMELPECPPPANVTLSQVGGFPFLDWSEPSGPSYYHVWRGSTPDGEYENAGTAFTTSFTDSTGFSSSRRFYYVTSVCPW